MSKPTRLKFTGTMLPVRDEDGNVVREEPDRWFPNVPARDLDEVDIENLSGEQIKTITGGPDPLYIDPDDSKSKKASLPVSGESSSRVVGGGEAGRSG